MPVPSPFQKFIKTFRKEPVVTKLSVPPLSLEDMPPYGESVVIYICNKSDEKTGEEVGGAVYHAFERAIGHRPDLAVDEYDNYSITTMFSIREPPLWKGARRV